MKDRFVHRAFRLRVQVGKKDVQGAQFVMFEPVDLLGQPRVRGPRN